MQKKLGLMIAYSGAEISINMNLIRHVEALGFDSVWTAEAYGSDAMTPLTWIAAQTQKIRLGTAVAQIPARSPACCAMTAMTIDALSGGRMILGLGTSGPQVVEGWHAQPFSKPITWTRDYVTILRKIFARDERIDYQGERIQMPYRGPGAQGLGKPLKSILHGRKEIPIYIGSMSPKGIESTAEIADGLLLTCMNPERFDIFEPHLKKGFAKAGGGKSLDNFDIAPVVPVLLGNDVKALAQPLKNWIGLYVGGMGAKSKNFYKDYITALGYEEVAEKIQDLYLAGKKAEAIALVPDSLIDELALIGPKERIQERLEVWKKAPVGTMLLAGGQPEAFELVAESVL